MRRKTVYRAIEGIDREQLEQFQAGMRKRYSDEHILDELRACAKRLGRSPTMREFEADPGTTVHPQTVIEHFKSWNRAKRLAGLVPRRFATQDELLKLLRDLGDELGRVPTAKDIEARKGAMFRRCSRASRPAVRSTRRPRSRSWASARWSASS